uniref:DUF834 domain-containing protein n=1 Tax=Oryza nivara TaxID=4536 RepID=A0A0E0HQQ5_ORYNI
MAAVGWTAAGSGGGRWSGGGLFVSPVAAGCGKGRRWPDLGATAAAGKGQRPAAVKEAVVRGHGIGDEDCDGDGRRSRQRR